MKNKLFYSTGVILGSDSESSGRLLRRQGLVLDFSALYSNASMFNRKNRFAALVSGFLPFLVIRYALRLINSIFDAFRIVISSQVV